jgi:hypothetical protein
VDGVVDGRVRKPGPLVQAGNVEHAVRQPDSLNGVKILFKAHSSGKGVPDANAMISNHFTLIFYQFWAKNGH